MRFRVISVPDEHVFDDGFCLRRVFAAEVNCRETQLRRSIERLGHGDRVLLYLYYWLDLPLDEIAQALGISPPAAKGRLYRAVGRLRERLTLPEEMA